MDPMGTGKGVIRNLCDANLEFDTVVDHCVKMLSQDSEDLSSSSKSKTSGNVSAKKRKAKNASKTMIRKNTQKRLEDRPKRPLSAYNFFFKHEREKIIMTIAAAEGFDPEKVLKDLRIASSDKMKKRRLHRRKFYRTIGFAALTKRIAAKWKVLDAADKIQ
uniref:HMG box domain-containing protein n=1 Tax=Ditylum brightwellii TaxID=49249 RepID=A0A7S1Z484_9STRA|mmetsp:Transcript_23998/g.35785  ORF Transcript_23998/g.35785 Transcript_23998/m.35785 type:complete len:161 (+) Transcript_23998:273-755(+)